MAPQEACMHYKYCTWQEDGKEGSKRKYFNLECSVNVRVEKNIQNIQDVGYGQTDNSSLILQTFFVDFKWIFKI
jgi:recombination DNA repair RAD52 pathway protein